MIFSADFPYYFNSNACASCGGQCCRGWGGYVWISVAELEHMAGAKRMAAAVFAKQYARQVNGRLSLQERVINGEHFCCFFDRITRRCTMYENRPEQCRTFPFWDSFKEGYQELLLECPGISLP